MRTWEAWSGVESHYAVFERDPFQIVVGRNLGGNPHTDAAGVYSVLDLFDGKLDRELREHFGEAMLAEVKALARELVIGHSAKPGPWAMWSREVDRWTTSVIVDLKGIQMGGGDINPHGSQYGGYVCTLREFVDEKTGDSTRAAIRAEFGDVVLAEVTALAWKNLLDDKFA